MTIICLVLLLLLLCTRIFVLHLHAMAMIKSYIRLDILFIYIQLCANLLTLVQLIVYIYIIIIIYRMGIFFLIISKIIIVSFLYSSLHCSTVQLSISKQKYIIFILHSYILAVFCFNLLFRLSDSF